MKCEATCSSVMLKGEIATIVFDAKYAVEGEIISGRMTICTKKVDAFQVGKTYTMVIE